MRKAVNERLQELIYDAAKEGYGESRNIWY